MKKALLTCLTGIVLVWIVPGSSFSQNLDNIVRLNMDFSSGKFTSSFGKTGGKKDPDSVRLNELNVKAVRHFTRHFENASDIKWSKLDKGYFVVYFALDDISSRALYNKRGKLSNIIRDYKEDKLLSEVRHRIKTTFYDYNIYHVTEIHWYDYDQLAYEISYVAILQDNKISDNKTSWKIIRIEDEMTVIKEYDESW